MKVKMEALVGALLVAGCAHLQNLTTSPPNDWQRTLYYTRTNVDAHNYFAADKLLDEYVRTHPGTREANETAFWKAAYTVDPANDAGSLSGGIAGLDAYLASNPEGLYRNEATVLRRTAAVAEESNVRRAGTVDTVAGPATKDTIVVVSKSREEQIANLKEQLAKSKDELAKLTAELERIKKRLANPNG